MPSSLPKWNCNTKWNASPCRHSGRNLFCFLQPSHHWAWILVDILFVPHSQLQTITSLCSNTYIAFSIRSLPPWSHIFYHTINCQSQWSSRLSSDSPENTILKDLALHVISHDNMIPYSFLVWPTPSSSTFLSNF